MDIRIFRSCQDPSPHTRCTSTMISSRCKGQGDSVLGLTPETATTTVPDDDDWDSEIEVSETDFGLGDRDSISHHKIHTSAAVRKVRKIVCILEDLQQEREGMLDKIIRKSDAVAIFDRFHKRSATLQEIASSSVGIAGWARFERKAQQREALLLFGVSSSVIAVPMDGFQTTGAIGG